MKRIFLLSLLVVLLSSTAYVSVLICAASVAHGQTWYDQQMTAMHGLNCYDCHSLSSREIIPGSHSIRHGMGLDQFQMCKTCHPNRLYSTNQADTQPVTVVDRGYDPTWPGVNNMRIYIFDIAADPSTGQLAFSTTMFGAGCVRWTARLSPSPGYWIEGRYTNVANPGVSGTFSAQDLLPYKYVFLSWDYSSLPPGVYEVRLTPYMISTPGIPFVFQVSIDGQYQVAWRFVTAINADGSFAYTDWQSGDTLRPMLGQLTELKLYTGSGATEIAHLGLWTLQTDQDSLHTPDLAQAIPARDQQGRHFLIWKMANQFGGDIGFFFNNAVNGTNFLFQPSHLGQGTISVGSDVNGNGRLDAGEILRVLPVEVVRPSRLGTTQNAFDAEIINVSNIFGAPPQFIKGIVAQESEFRERDYRYEPRYDYDYIAPAPRRNGDIRDREPYRYYRVRTGINALLDLNLAWGARLWNVIGPDSPDVRFRTFYVLNDANRDGFYSMREIMDANPGNRWGAPLDDMRNYTAQTTLASSYGLMQVMWATAASTLSWRAYDNPRYYNMNQVCLTGSYEVNGVVVETPCGNSVRYRENLLLGGENLLYEFKDHNQGIAWYDYNSDGRPDRGSGMFKAGGFSDFREWRTYWMRGFLAYNGGTEPAYDDEVWARTLNYLPQ